MSNHRNQSPPVDRTAFAGYRFPASSCWLSVGISDTDCPSATLKNSWPSGIEVDHVTIHRWVQRFTPLLIDAARPCRHTVGRRWFVDETYVKVAGKWRYVYRAIDEHG